MWLAKDKKKTTTKKPGKSTEKKTNKKNLVDRSGHFFGVLQNVQDFNRNRQYE